MRVNVKTLQHSGTQYGDIHIGDLVKGREDSNMNIVGAVVSDVYNRSITVFYFEINHLVEYELKDYYIGEKPFDIDSDTENYKIVLPVDIFRGSIELYGRE